ncbi:hypothetical protein ABEB36_007323 [Hypothenemus hampei]|uniref:2-(3-amino-3-carboxypropyl)histidine synthase n=1 Tax=Hypothenemus hampei TaxID=57062 RepID=A0ABD1EXJ7_HYPHA
MPQFSTNEFVSLEKDVEVKRKTVEANSHEIDRLYEIQRCLEWIKTNNFKKVCLQFPDHLLPHSSDVAVKLQNLLGHEVYILGDTAYESCCIDYVAAAHINADAIIHFGSICFSKTSANIPYLNIYEKHYMELKNLETAIHETFNEKEIQELTLLIDDDYIHYYDDLCEMFNICRICKVDEDLSELSNYGPVLYIGQNERKLINIDLSFNVKCLYYYEPDKNPPKITPFQQNTKIIKRRHFLIEKIKDANTIGIVIGTLGVKNYLKVIERLKKLAEANGKKYYLISVGKPTVAKLANLGEIDIYVMITCAMNEIYDSRDFYKPIVTPFDVEIALNNTNGTNINNFTFDYNFYLNKLENIDNVEKGNETDVSLLSGKLRSLRNPESKLESESSQIALKSEGTLTTHSHFGAGYLQQRSWKGLEQNLGDTEVKLAEEGRTGIAQEYKNEHF